MQPKRKGAVGRVALADDDGSGYFPVINILNVEEIFGHSMPCIV